MKELITSLISDAVARARLSGDLASDQAPFTVERPGDSSHGDMATNAALVMAKAERKAPRAVAEIIARYIEPRADVEEVKVAGPGFINFRMAASYWHSEIRRALAAGPSFWCSDLGRGRRVQVEFLSANPTGPLTVGHGRNAVLGDTLARLYEATGHQVTREYYFNNGGRQMRLLGESVRARYLEELGRAVAFPEEGYQGEYIREIALGLVQRHEAALAEEPSLEPFRAAAEERIFGEIRATCEHLRVGFDVYTNELDLIRAGKVDKVLAALEGRGLVARYDGATWLRGEPLGLPKDLVLLRSGPDREPTYRTTDIAYYIDKLSRGFDLVVGVFGADHIAEHQGVVAALRALGHDTACLRTVIYQFVTLMRGGEKVKMSTRKATYVTLEELLDEVGPDVARFFFLFRKSDTHLDFDLDLAKTQAPENPVFYVQYAHARLESVLREAAKAGLAVPADLAAVDLALLSAEELAIARRVLGFPEVVGEALDALEPHRIPFALLELAGEFHRYYNKPANRIIGSDRELSRVRLVWARLVKGCIARGLELIGVNAPERM